MNRLIRKISPREIMLLVLTITVIVVAIAVRWYIVPAYDQWQSLKYLTQMQTAEYTRLRTNLSIQPSVDKEFSRLGPEIYQVKSDQITLSEYLRELETIAHHPSLTLISMKPLSAAEENDYKIYRLKLSVAGKLQEILQFIGDVTHGKTITGLQSFTLRAVQGHNMAECNLSLWMVRLIPKSPEQNEKDFSL